MSLDESTEGRPPAASPPKASSPAATSEARGPAPAASASESTAHEPPGAELLRRLQKIASQVPGVVYQFQQRPDGSSCFPYASDRIREIYRVTPEEVREDASKVFERLHPDDYDAVVESIQRSADTMTPWQFEYRVAFPNGDVRWLYGNAIPERASDGSSLWHGFITDVTEQKRAEEARAKLEEQLRHSQKMESVGQLAGGVAHDFNNLLTSVIAYIELSRQTLPASSTAVEYLGQAMDAALRGAELSQQLLAFARKKVVIPEPVNVRALVERLGPMIRRVLGERVDVALSLAEDTGMARVDLGSLEQVVMNLVVNARDAMPDGGHLSIATARVALDMARAEREGGLSAGDYVMLSVTDTGHGMSAEVIARVFEPFFTTKAVGTGTGLGLAMCHGIARQAGGAMTVTSAPGRGACFRLYLPRLVTEVVTPKPASIPPPALQGSETILVVEDEPSILEVASAALEQLGYRIVRASNGHEALERVVESGTRIDLLVTDVVMPRMGGRALADHLTVLMPELEVLYTSGYAEQAIAQQGVLEPGLHFLQKPYTLRALTARVRDVLDARRRRAHGAR